MLNGGASSTQLVQVNLWIPHLFRLHQLVPSDLASGVSGGARHHAGKGGFRALGGLIMEITVRDALDKGLLLFRIGELEIGGETSRHRKRLSLRLILRGEGGGRRARRPAMAAGRCSRSDSALRRRQSCRVRRYGCAAPVQQTGGNRGSGNPRPG